MNDTELVLRDGKVALKQIGSNQRPVTAHVGDRVYQASVQHNVWIAWVEPEDVNPLLEKKIQGCSCNNGSTKPLYKIASPLDVSLFDTGERPI